MKRTLGPFSIGRLLFFGIAGGLLIAAFAFIPPLWNSAGKSYEVTRADVRLALADDAALSVHEELTFDFTGSFQGAYRDILLRRGERITDVSVSEAGDSFESGANTTLGSTDSPGRFGTEQFPSSGGKTVRVVWHYRATDEERTFTISYRVERATRAYDDVIEIPWAIWGDQWDFALGDLHAELELPASGQATVPSAWVRPREIDPEIVTSPGRLVLDTERVPEHQAVGLRVSVPRSAVSSVDGARVISGPGLEEIERSEAVIDDGQGGLWLSLKKLVFGAPLLVFGIWTAVVLGLLALLLVLARERRADVPSHLAEPPEDLPPALAYALASEGGYDPRLVLATLLDLVDRGYYEGKASKGDGLDLELKVPKERPPAEQLAEYEVVAIDFFDKLIGGGNPLLSSLADRIPRHSKTWRTRWEAMVKALDGAETGELGWDRDLRRWRLALVALALAGYAALTVSYFQRSGGLLLIPVVAIVVGMALLLSVRGDALRRVDAASRERSARWQAFARWTEDFPSLSDDPPATLNLWRRIMVYGVAFGTAERMIGSGRIPAPVTQEATGTWSTYALAGGLHTGSFDANRFASGFATQVAPKVQSSSSSGGFSGGFSSGGGGGFSGGGGGGAW